MWGSLPSSFSSFSSSSITEKEPVTFIKSYGNCGTGPSSSGYSVKQTDDSGYIITGYKRGEGGNTNLYLLKVNSKGDSLWEKIYGDRETDEEGYSIIPTSDGGFIVVGVKRNMEDNNSDIYILKVDSRGESIWVKTYGERENEEVGYSVCSSLEEEGFIVCGYTSSSNNPAKVFLLKIDKNGNFIWSKQIGDETRRWYGREIIPTSDGNFVITGSIATPDSGFNVLLLKIDGSGNMLWSKSLGSTIDEEGCSLAEGKDGKFVITGCQSLRDTNSCGTCWVIVYQTDVDGELLLPCTFGKIEEPYCSIGKSIKRTRDGGFIVVGAYAYTPVYRSGNVYLIRLTSYCTTLWTKTFETIVGWDYGSSIELTNDNGFIITGSGNNTRGNNVILIKTDKNGSAVSKEW